MKGLFIINPSSGTKTIQKRALQAVVDLLEEKDCEGVFVFYTHKKDDAYQTARQLSPGEYDFVVAVGGDGTVNEVAAGLYESGSDIPLAIIAAGTVNDFAIALGLPRTRRKIVKMLKHRHTERIDLGKFNDTYFYNVAAGGGLCEVAHYTSPDLKTVFGRLAYLSEGVKKFADINLSTVPLTYEIDGVPETFDTFYFTCSNSKSVGGFGKMAPDARVNDGKLDLCIVKKVDPANVFPLFSQLQSGRHVNNPATEYRQITSLKVYSAGDPDARFPLDHDGEPGGNIPVSVEVVRGAIRLITPEPSFKTRRLNAHIKG